MLTEYSPELLSVAPFHSMLYLNENIVHKQNLKCKHIIGNKKNFNQFLTWRGDFNSSVKRWTYPLHNPTMSQRIFSGLKFPQKINSNKDDTHHGRFINMSKLVASLVVCQSASIKYKVPFLRGCSPAINTTTFFVCKWISVTY